MMVESTEGVARRLSPCMYVRGVGSIYWDAELQKGGLENSQHHEAQSCVGRCDCKWQGSEEAQVFMHSSSCPGC